MKNKAFTLIELLGTIIILGVLVLVAFPPLLNQIRKTKSEISDATEKLIIDASKDYVQNNENNYETIEGITYCINISTLTEQNYLNEKIKDKNLNDIDTTKKIKMIYHNNNFNYEVTDICNNNTLTRNNIEVPIVTENSGLYKSTTDMDRFIYRGGNPINNWIELNEGTDESPNYVKYRIISFENDGTIKVIREESIGKKVWDNGTDRQNNENTYCESSNGCNVWGTQTTTYYNNQTLTNLNQDFLYNYYQNSTSPSLENYTNTGTVTQNSTLNKYLNHLNENGDYWEPVEILDKHIVNHSFNVGGIYYTQSYTGGDKGIKKEKQEENIYTSNGKIGLINITEYVEASTNLTCTSTYSNYYYNENFYPNKNRSNTHYNISYDDYPCSNRTYNWMSKAIDEWVISAYSRTRFSVWYINKLGYFSSGHALNQNEIRPVFYLKPTISLTGEGTEENPYRIVGEE